MNLFLMLFFLVSNAVYSEISIYLENGLALNTINKIRIPGDTGTLVKLGEGGFKTPSSYFYRINLNYNFNNRHNLKLLFAPLKFSSDGIASSDIYFNNKTFNTGSEIEVFYKFNSYRLTYRYDFYRGNDLDMGIGLTAKIRDAKISFTDINTSSTNENIGFVPLINFNLNYKFNSKFNFIFDFDALAAPQGRAEDVLLSFAYKFDDSFKVNAGYRILEGGADNEKVYTFALINYFLIGIEILF